MTDRPWSIGDIIRILRQNYGFTLASLAHHAKLDIPTVHTLEHNSLEIEHVTPKQWQALDRLAAVFGFKNGAAFFKLVPPPKTIKRRMLES